MKLEKNERFAIYLSLNISEDIAYVLFTNMAIIVVWFKKTYLKINKTHFDEKSLQMHIF